MLASLRGVSLNEALSGVFGSISLTAWICLLIPQLLTNYKSKSAEGLSMAFLAVWLFGDIANLFGALVTGLAPTATALAAYFCVSDLVLISQCLYYNTLASRRAARRQSSTSTTASDEDEPLLQRRRRASSSANLPGSQRRNSVRRGSSQHSGFVDPLTRVVTGEDETPGGNSWVNNSLGLTAVWIVGAAGWFVSYKVGAWDGPDGGGGGNPDEASAQSAYTILGMVLGYLSALCYLCARLPQIYKNYTEKSCEGLALLFFLLSLTGNFTYGMSVFSYSQEPAYLVKTIPWLLGSLGTMVEDCVIFYQFRIYAPERLRERQLRKTSAPA